MTSIRRFVYRVWNRVDRFLARLGHHDRELPFFAVPALFPIRVTYEEFRDGEWRNVGDMEYDPTKRGES